MSRVLLRRGIVHSPTAPAATAMCVDGATIAWLGDERGAEHFADNADSVVDLGGRFVGPAFVDAHIHAAQTGLRAESLDLSPTPSLVAALDSVERYARTTTEPVLLGFGWDETRWPEARPFTRAEVDRAVGQRVAYLARVDVHSAVVSSAFLAKAPQLRTLDGWDEDGRVSRAAHHCARDLTNELMPPGQRREAIGRGLRTAAAAGVGAVHEIGAPHLSRRSDFATIAELSREAPLPTVVGYWGELGAVDTAKELGCIGAAGDLCVDGALGSRTAATSQPYADAAGSGHLYVDAEQVCEHVVACTRAGLQAGFHCIGDRAVATAIDGLRQAATIVGVQPMVQARHRLEHLEMLDVADIATLRELGVVASVQPAFDAAWGGATGMYAARLGAERALAMNPFRSLVDAGVVLAFGSDTPVTRVDPWGGVRAAVWHHNAGQRIPAAAAFAAHTRGGWHAARRDGAGVLEPGAAATYAVWDVPGALDAGSPPLPDLAPDLPLPTCARTVVEGHVVHEVEGALA